MAARIPSTACFEQEPGAPFGFVNPNFDQAGGGDVTLFFADIVGLAQARGKRFAILAQLGEHVLRLNILGIVNPGRVACGQCGRST